VKLTLLSGGTLDADRGLIFPARAGSGRRVTLPVMMILIESERHRVLVDTGMPPAAAGDGGLMRREYGWDPGWIRAVVAPEERADAQLAGSGLRTSDLDLVVCTHFHTDHAGGNSLFAGVPIAVQEAELTAARGGDDYLPVWDAPGLQFQAVRGDWSPLPGVEMIFTPGHTPGHQSMLVRLGEQPWLFTCDAVYTEEHWRSNDLGAVRDVAEARASLERLREIAAAENARIVFGHDVAQWESLRKAPDFYGSAP
jgi:N-acyl homoserine lactone hydrolase